MFLRLLSKTMSTPKYHPLQHREKSRSSSDSASDRDDAGLFHTHELGHNSLRPRRSRCHILLTHTVIALLTGVAVFVATSYKLNHVSLGTCYDNFNAPCRFQPYSPISHVQEGL